MARSSPFWAGLGCDPAVPYSFLGSHAEDRLHAGRGALQERRGHGDHRHLPRHSLWQFGDDRREARGGEVGGELPSRLSLEPRREPRGLKVRELDAL